MILFFDTETTGLPKNYKAPVTATDNWPRMVQLAWILTDDDGTVKSIKDVLIKPVNFEIPLSASKVHGITTQKALTEGKDLAAVLMSLEVLISQADILVAHNMEFDEKIIGAEFVRAGISTTLFKKKRICTMRSTINYCAIQTDYGFKFPKLSELHTKLFGSDFSDAHNAASDIGATARCYWELKRRKII